MIKKRKINLLALLIVFLLLLVMISYTGEDRERLTFIEDSFLGLLIPVQSFFAGVGQNIQSFFEAALFHQEMRAENARLKEALALAQQHLSYLTELQKENERLRSTLDFEEKSDMTLLAAEVIARDPSQWFKTITLNRGAHHGIYREMAVITPQGLVGMVSSVSRFSCQVMLITDPRLSAHTLVQRSREPGVFGVIEGSPDDYFGLKMVNLPPSANIQPGDTIITSGMGGIFPKGLPVGIVEEVGMEPSGLARYALVRPFVNFDRLEEVIIVLKGRLYTPIEFEPIEIDLDEIQD